MKKIPQVHRLQPSTTDDTSSFKGKIHVLQRAMASRGIEVQVRREWIIYRDKQSGTIIGRERVDSLITEHS